MAVGLISVKSSTWSSPVVFLGLDPTQNISRSFGVYLCTDDTPGSNVIDKTQLRDVVPGFKELSSLGGP